MDQKANSLRARVRRLSKRMSEDHEDEAGEHLPMISSEDDDTRESGVGILEFSPDKAGMDITPARYDFEHHREKRNSGTFSSITGN